MKVRQLLQHWEKTAKGELTRTSYSISLPVEDAAKLQALSEMYPKRPVEQLITDLLSAALREIEEEMPYIKGNKVVAEDEKGDPIYEDTGPTPRFLELTRKHLAQLSTR